MFSPHASGAIAHTSNSGSPHLLAKHLRQVSQRSAVFAQAFADDGWAGLAGLWHDLGKYHAQFQEALWILQNDKNARVDKPPHAAAGAFWARECLAAAGREPHARILEFLIACHHTGLQDWADLRRRLDDADSRETKVWRELRPQLPEQMQKDGTEAFLQQNLPAGLPDFKDGFGFSFWLRMLFSCLIDADRLDAEASSQGERPPYPPLVPELKSRFDQSMQKMDARTTQRLANAELQADVVKARRDVLADCRRAGAERDRGFFTLTVPTGGGKTLSSMAFALEHAEKHGMERVIYVIPYTSIIEQNAGVFKEIFGAENVIEHHSTFDDSAVRKDDSAHQAPSHDRACENWDAPIIVTTSVQFFESLFAASTKRVRKLHNIANSVVILDEAQLLPPEFLQPILKALEELKTHYGVSVVLCTATQPALGRGNPALARFGIDLENAEIVRDKEHLFKTLRRTTIQRLPELLDTPQEWPVLAERLARHEQVLCIVNRRDDARALYQALKAELPGQDEGLFHLSALMCPLHRRAVIAEIKARLHDHLPTRVISTQLIEAGVDVDFPVVYRALAGLDSIAQAAGRCNREGLRAVGEVFLFRPEKRAPAGLLRLGEQATTLLLKRFALQDDPLLPEWIERYFKTLHSQIETFDKERILEKLKVKETPLVSPHLATVAEKFRFIQDGNLSVIVWHDADDLAWAAESSKRAGLLRAARATGQPETWLLRRLQQVTVTIPRTWHQEMCKQGDIEEIFPGIFLQTVKTLYTDTLGFVGNDSRFQDAESFIV